MMKITIIICVLVILQIYGQDIPQECQSCNISISWDEKLLVCGFQSDPTSTVNFVNKFCVDELTTLFPCMIENSNYTFLYPGVCGCPNNCYQDLGRGICFKNATCKCSSGWTGTDCSLVDCNSNPPNSCNNNGKCYNNEPFCSCKEGHNLNDCSGTTTKLIDVVKVVNESEYSKNEKYGDNHPIFNESTIAQVFIRIDPKDLDFLLNPDNTGNRTGLSAQMDFINENLQLQNINITIRIQGGASRYFSKKSWKIDFSDGKQYDISGFSLKAAEMDVSFVREKMSIAVYRSMGLPIYRGSYSNVYINDQNFGFYVLLESVDKEFLKSRFGKHSDNSLFYKVSGGGFFYYFNDSSQYSVNFVAQNEMSNNYTGVMNLCYVLSQFQNTSEWIDQFSSIFDIDLFLRTWVAEVMTDQVDGLLNGNNFYLYWNPNPNVNKFQIFRHDMDLSWGNFNGVGDRNATDPIYNFTLGYPTPLTLLLTIPQFRDKYTYYIQQLLQNYFNLESPLIKYATQLHEMVIPSAVIDNYHRIDFAWSFEEVIGSLNTTFTRPYNSPNVQLSIFDYINVRYTSAMDQLDD